MLQPIEFTTAVRFNCGVSTSPNANNQYSCPQPSHADVRTILESIELYVCTDLVNARARP